MEAYNIFVSLGSRVLKFIELKESKFQ